MRVQLLAHTKVVSRIPDYTPHLEDVPTHADDLAEQAGRLCYLAWFRRNPKTAKNRGYLKNLIGQGHGSVLEHPSATFYISGVTRNCTHEFIRHRHLSYSELSQRYADAAELEFIMHPGLKGLTAFSSLIKDNFDQAKKIYEGLVEHLLPIHGGDRKKARQAARHVLPGGTETRIVISGNLRAWREVLYKRLPPVADEEIRQVAALILAELRQIAPNTFQDFDEYGY